MNFRAKVKVESILKNNYGETITFRPVTNGSLEDNSYSKWTPSGKLELTITNPDIIDKIRPDDVFYVDFKSVE